MPILSIPMDGSTSAQVMPCRLMSEVDASHQPASDVIDDDRRVVVECHFARLERELASPVVAHLYPERFVQTLQR